MHPDRKFGIESDDNKRHLARKFGPHAWLGLFFGGLAGQASIIIRDNYLSAKGTISTLWNKGLDKNSAEKFGIESPDDKRDKWLKFGPHAWLGLMVGGFIGLAAITFRDSIESGMGTIQTLWHAGLDTTRNSETKDGIENHAIDPRHDFRKFGPHAWLGLIVGGFIGLAAINRSNRHISSQER